jgi:hypothetical protein
MVQTYLEEVGSLDAPSIDYQLYPGFKKVFFLSLKNDLSSDQDEDYAFYKAGKTLFKTYFNGLLKKISEYPNYKEPRWYIDFLAYIINKTGTDHSHTSLDKVLKYYNAVLLSDDEKLASLRTCLITLHRHGLIIYYNTPGLKDVVWLNPQELVKYIQENVLSKETLKIDEGIIHKHIFEKDIVIDEKILQLLIEQKVVFLHNPTGETKDKEYIIPNFLPLANENDPGYQLFIFGLQQPDFIIKFNDFIPFGFINQLICFYGLQPDVKKFWRNQLLFTLNNEARVLICIDFVTLQVKVYIQLLSSASSSKVQVSTYIFYSLLALYWDKMGNENILTYNDFLTLYSFYELGVIGKKWLEGNKIRFEYKKEKKYEIWDSFIKDESTVPTDAFLSVDNERFIKYESLFNLKGQYLLPAYLLKDGRVDIASGKEIPVSPFAPFTHKKLAGMKNVFISYSHDDLAARQTMQQYLINLVRDGLIEIWQDGLIQAGEDWDKKIKTSLETADICILLVSQSFIASTYSHEVEFKTIMENRKKETTRIIPVLLRDCDWKNWKVYPPEILKSLGEDATNFAIGNFQFLPEENKRLKPINKWTYPEEAWMQVADEIRKFCEEK